MYVRIPIFMLPILFMLISCDRKAIAFENWRQDTCIRYTMKIPQKCNCFFTEARNMKQRTYSYPDSSYVFISEIGEEYTPPAIIVKTYGKDVNLRFIKEDSLDFKGTETTGKRWEVRKLKYVVYGYGHVPKINKIKFDEALNSVRMKTIWHSSRKRKIDFKSTWIVVKCRDEWRVL